MAITDYKVSETYAGRDIASLPDRPNEAGMSASLLKARFDQLGKEVIPNYNDLIDFINLNLFSGGTQIGHTHNVDILEDGTTNRLYTNVEKTKLAGIAEGAEVNQNAFSNVKVGSTAIASTTKMDTLELVAGLNVSIAVDALTKKITLSATGDLATEAVQSYIEDIGNYFTSLNVEGALQEIGANITDIKSQMAETAYLVSKSAGADNTGDTPSTDVISDMLSQAATAKRTLKFPAGTFVIDQSIVKEFSGQVLEIEGEGQFATTILWRGDGVMFDISGAGQINLKNITFTSFKSGDSQAFLPNSTAFKSNAPIIATNVQFIGFETFVLWAGGYYHKFINCRIMRAKTAFKDFNANNLSFIGCRVAHLEKLVETISGTGPVSFIGGSIENISNTAFSTLHTAVQVNITNSYVENYPAITPPTGITGDYKSAFLAYRPASINIDNCTIIANGFRRIIYSPVAIESVKSVGNRIEYQAVGDLEFYILSTGEIKNILLNDNARQSITGQLGTYTAQYINDVAHINKPNFEFYDVFQSKYVINEPSWIAPTFLNGWIQRTGTGVPIVAYRKHKNKVEVKGVTNGVNATAGVIFTLPEDYRPSEHVYKTVSDNLGNINVIRVLTTGGVFCENITDLNKIGFLILDGLSFDV